MITTTRPATPTVVRIDRDREHTFGLAGTAVTGLARALTTTVVTAVHAPRLAGLATCTTALVWLACTGRPLATALVLGVVTAVVAVVWWRRPLLVRRAGSRLVGEWLRVVVYRPRWTTACLAAATTQKVGSTVHLPVLARHEHTPTGRDVLTVRMAPGQTLTTWQGAAASLASTFTAHRVTARAASRPGWVVLDVLRRDPLAGEITATDPARLPRTGPVVLGVDEHGHPLTLDPYSTPHAALQGATRSGKSSTCYALLAALAHRDDVTVCGIDPSGLLLDPFTHGRGSSFIATGTRPDDLDRCAQVLADLVDLMDDRVRDLRAAGVDKLTDYTPMVPAVWVVLEEYPGLITAARALDAERGSKPGQRLAPRVESLVGRLVKEGAKVGVLVLALAQRMSADAMKTDDRSNLGMRVTHRVDNNDAVAMLHEGLPREQVAAVRVFAPGVALAESPGVPVRRVRMHYTSYTVYRARVAAGLARTTTTGAPSLGADVTTTVVTLPATTVTAPMPAADGQDAA